MPYYPAIGLSADVPSDAVLPNHSLGLQSGANVVEIRFAFGADIDSAGFFIPLLGCESALSSAMQQRKHCLLIFGQLGTVRGHGSPAQKGPNINQGYQRGAERGGLWLSKVRT